MCRKDVARNADRLSLRGDATADSVPNPPRGVCREPVALRWVELLNALDEADVSLLDEVHEIEPRPLVALCDAHHEAEVRLDERVAVVAQARLEAGEFLPELREFAPDSRNRLAQQATVAVPFA